MSRSSGVRAEPVYGRADRPIGEVSRRRAAARRSRPWRFLAARLEAAADAVIAAVVGDWLRGGAGIHCAAVCLAAMTVLTAIIWYVVSNPNLLGPNRSLRMSQSGYIRGSKQRNPWQHIGIH